MSWGYNIHHGEYSPNIVICKVTDGNQTYCGDHFATYTNAKSLYCTPETNTILYVTYTSKKNSVPCGQTHFLILVIFYICYLSLKNTYAFSFNNSISSVNPK